MIIDRTFWFICFGANLGRQQDKHSLYSPFPRSLRNLIVFISHAGLEGQDGNTLNWKNLVLGEWTKFVNSEANQIFIQDQNFTEPKLSSWGERTKSVGAADRTKSHYGTRIPRAITSLCFLRIRAPQNLQTPRDQVFQANESDQIFLQDQNFPGANFAIREKGPNLLAPGIGPNITKDQILTGPKFNRTKTLQDRNLMDHFSNIRYIQQLCSYIQ